MSQQGRLVDDPSELETLTGNTGGVVGPNATGNIDVVGSAPYTVSGNPGTFTLTITDDGTLATTYTTDSGNAIPAANVLNVLGGTNMNTAGAGSTVTINLDLDVLGLTDLTVDNLELNGNTLSATDTNGNISITPDGTGGVIIPTNLTLGETTQDVTYTINGATIDAVVAVHTEGASDLGGFVEERHTDTAGFGPHHIFLRTRGNEATSTIVADGDALARLIAAGYDGTDYAQSAEIRVEVDGTPGANDMPGRIKFFTSPDGTQVPALAMTIDSTRAIFMTSSLDIIHTSAEADDHAFEIDCDAAGFGDVKAINIDYITGTLAAGDDEEVILVNIDESASTGGEVSGYQILATEEGSATIHGYTTGININPILHNAGTFGDADSILNKAVDVTAALASGGAGNISVFVADNDTVTYGDAAKFNEMEFILDTPASGSGIAPTFEFSTGGAGFTAFTPSDGTNGLRNSGAVLWIAADLSGWATNASGFFEIRQTRTRNSLTTTPILDEVQISSTTEFTWDKNGDLDVNSITLATALTVPNGGTGAATLTDGGILLGSGTSAITATGQPTNGQLLIGSTGVDPVLGTLTAGTGISITEGAASITIDATGSGMAWNVETGTSATMVVDNGYIGNNAGTVTFTLPDTAAVGSIVRVTALQGVWAIAQNAGETIYFGSSSTTTGVGGSLTSTDPRDTIELVCVVADTDWQALSSIGNITVV